MSTCYVSVYVAPWLAMLGAFNEVRSSLGLFLMGGFLSLALSFRPEIVS